MAIQQIKLPSGETYVISDWSDIPLWSRCQIAAAQAQDILIFNYVEAQPLPGPSGAAATRLDTNLDQASALPLDQQMIIFSCQIRFDEADAANLGTIQAEADCPLGLSKWASISYNTLFSFSISNAHPSILGPVSEFPSGGGVYLNIAMDASDAGTSSSYQVNNGYPSADSVRALALPVHLGPMEPFKGKLEWPRGALPNSAAEAGISVFLYGVRQRPVG